MGKGFRHFITITKHRHQVIRNCAHCGLFWQSLRHDLTKYGYTEFHWSKINYAGNHSPVFEERKSHGYFSYICQHHTRRNKHHWEYWVDYFCGYMIVHHMPWRYATEMVCDMLSASKTYDPKGFTRDITLKYFQERKARYYMTEPTRQYIEWCLTRYRDLGFKGLKKKDTQAKYKELMEGKGLTEIISSLHIEGPLPNWE